MTRATILFMAEAVTLAHVARPLALAGALAPERYEVHFACAGGYEHFFADSGLRHWPLASISSARFLAALAAGQPVYDQATLQRYVEEDLHLLAELRPDVVVGDFRLSLSASARIARLPYVALANAYWSPYARQHYTVPSLAMSRVLPIPLAQAMFQLMRPLAFARHARPLNQVRQAYRLPSLGPDLRRVYTDADHTWYADVPEMFPTDGLPATHAYLGPVLWSPPVALPPWWHALPPALPVVYVTLGSSGQGDLLPLVLHALAPLPLTAMVATAGRPPPARPPANAYMASYVPGEAAARRAALVICNGGSPTSQQALAAGVPVLGIAGNLDQFLNMDGVMRAGAGAVLRADRLQEGELQHTVMALLEQPGPRAAAARLAQVLAAAPAPRRFVELLDGVLAS
ncbi:glycosyltransferase [Oxalobacteraceae bacterium A2-2]